MEIEQLFQWPAHLGWENTDKVIGFQVRSLLSKTIFLGLNFFPLVFLRIDLVGSGVIVRLDNFWVLGICGRGCRTVYILIIIYYVTLKSITTSKVHGNAEFQTSETFHIIYFQCLPINSVVFSLINLLEDKSLINFQSNVLD